MGAAIEYAVDAARIAGIPEPTMWSWTSRGHISRPPYTMGDVLGLMAARRLTERGMKAEAACEIAKALAGDWSKIAREDHEGRRVLLVIDEPKDGRTKYRFHLVYDHADIARLLNSLNADGLFIVLSLNEALAELCERWDTVIAEREATLARWAARQ